jgi:hypothetical protein
MEMRRRWPNARGTRQEVSTAGFDPALALIYGNPNNTPTGPGLIIPQTVPPSGQRYLFLLASFQLNAGEMARLIGIRQYLSIATLQINTFDNPEDNYSYPLELPVTSPMWHFTDANVSWHLRRYTSSPQWRWNANNKQNLTYKNSNSPTLLYVRAPGQFGGYIPPANGRPPGTVVVPDLGSFQDLRFPWQMDKAGDRTLDVELQGPATFGFFASVLQTNPDTRPTLTLPGTLPGGTTSAFPPEELFIQNFPTSYYYRIAGSLIFETPAFFEDDDRPTWCSPGESVPVPITQLPPPARGGGGQHPPRSGRPPGGRKGS